MPQEINKLRKYFIVREEGPTAARGWALRCTECPYTAFLKQSAEGEVSGVTRVWEHIRTHPPWGELT
jgi:hypothetical protein